MRRLTIDYDHEKTSAENRRLPCRLEIALPEFPVAIRIRYIGRPRRCSNWRSDRRHEPGNARQQGGGPLATTV